MAQKLLKAPRGAYDAIVFIEGSEVVAQDADGHKIASGTAGTDDETIIQTAIDELPTNGILKIVPDNYTLASGLVLDSAINIEAYGVNFLCGAVTGYAIDFSDPGTYSSSNKLEGATLLGDNTGANGIRFHSAKFCLLRDVSIRYFTGVGLDLDGYTDGTWYNDYHNVRIRSCADKGVYIHTTDIGRVTSIQWFGGEIRSCGYNIYHENCGTGNTFFGCNIENGVTEQIYNDGQLFLFGCRNESTGSIAVETDTNGTTIEFACRKTGITYIDTGLRYAFDQTGALKVKSLNDGNIYMANAYPSLQACVTDIESINTGTCIILDADTYDPVTIAGSNITFVGTGRYGSTGSIIDGGTTGHAVSINGARNINFNGIQFKTTAGAGNSYDAVYLGTVAYDRIGFHNCKFSSDRYGLYGYASGVRCAVTVSECDFDTIDDTAIRFHAASDGGGFKGIRIKDNRFANVPTAIYLGRCFDSFVTGNRFDSTITTALSTTTGASNGIFKDNIVTVGTISNLSTTVKVFQNIGYVTETSGSSTGTGAEQTIAHSLATIPTGCKAWIKYLVGSRYVTEMVPFDATNVYPTVTSGLSYEWRIE